MTSTDDLRLSHSVGEDWVPNEDQLADMYGTMVLIRHFEERTNELYLQGRIPSTLHLYIGQEAVAAGMCANLRDDDHLLSTHRPHGHAIAKGVAPREIMAELFAKVTGCCKAKGGSMHVGDVDVGMFPAIAIVGSNVPIASGVGLAGKLQGKDTVTACFFGDGASNTGAWHEGMNLAAVWDLPVVFVCENNLYAASTPFDTAFDITDIAQRAPAYGMPGVTVDGNDVLAVYKACHRAVERARRGEGPTLVECKTYRQCGHSRSDPRTYRCDEEEEEWERRDPIPQFRRWLLDQEVLTAERLDALDQKAEEIVGEAVSFAESSPHPELSELYTHVFEESDSG